MVSPNATSVLGLPHLWASSPQKLAQSSLFQFSVDVFLRPGIFDGALHEPLPPQVREAEVPADGESRAADLHQPPVDAEQAGKSNFDMIAMHFNSSQIDF